MNITIDKESLIGNVSADVNSKIDILLNNEKLEPSNYYITKNHRAWIERQLIFADYQVRKIILHLLDKEENEQDEDGKIVYIVKITHSMQSIYMPAQIEELLIDYISDKWMSDRGLVSSPKSAISAVNLQRVSHLSSTARKIPYRLI